LVREVIALIEKKVGELTQNGAKLGGTVINPSSSKHSRMSMASTSVISALTNRTEVEKFLLIG
jgi:hypothetical protein